MGNQREKKRDVLYFMAAVLCFTAVPGCRKHAPASASAALDGQARGTGRQWRILVVDSYHEGYPWNEGILAGVRSVLGGPHRQGTVDLEVIRMDAKRNTSEEYGHEAAQRAAAFIEMWKPDCVIAADDAASKFLIAPYYRDSQMPVVFCGVNWDASIYGFPCSNVTGMVEISLIPSLLETLQVHARGPRVGILGADNLSNRKEATNYRLRFGLEPTREVFVADFAEWKQHYLQLQEEVDMLILAPPSFIMSDSDKAEACDFVMGHTTIPTGSVEDWIAPYSLVCYAKDASELGAWAAATALEILDGRPPADIAVTTNQKAKIFLNMPLAKSLNVRFSTDLVVQATFIE